MVRRPQGLGGDVVAGRSRDLDAVTALTGYVVVLFAIPSPMMISAMGQVGGPSTLLAVVLFLWWVWHRVHRSEHWNSGAQPARNAALLFLLAVAVCYVHSAGLALPAAERSPGDGALIRLAGGVGLVCVLSEGVDSRERLWTLCRRWVLVIGGVGALAAFQIVTGQLWVDRLWLPFLTPPDGLVLIQRGLILRPSATATHPIELSAVLAMSMPLAFAVAGREQRRPRLFRTIAVGIPVLVLLTGSRTGLVCGAVAFLIMLFSWRSRTRLFAGVGAVGVLCVMFVAMPGFLGGITGLFSGASNDPSVASRTNSYGIVGSYWQHHPWLGRGVGTFVPEYWIFDNQYLNLLLGGGIVVVAAFMVMLLVACRSALRASRISRDRSDKQLAVAGLAGVVAGAISLALFDGFGFSQAVGSLFLLIGLCGSVHRLAVEGRAREPGLGTAGDLATASPGSQIERSDA